MAGQPVRRARREAGVIGRFDTEFDDARKKIALSLADITDAAIRSALGIYMEKDDGKGKKIVYQRPPNMQAVIYLMDRCLGVPKVEANPVADRLDTARAVVMEEQVILGLIAAQKRELDARAGKSEIELEMWPRQFVTEEEEMSNLRKLAEEVNKALMEMTPEKFEELTKDMDPSVALENLKGHLGREQSDIVAAVLEYKEKGGDDSPEDDDE